MKLSQEHKNDQNKNLKNPKKKNTDKKERKKERKHGFLRALINPRKIDETVKRKSCVFGGFLPMPFSVDLCIAQSLGPDLDGFSEGQEARKCLP